MIRLLALLGLLLAGCAAPLAELTPIDGSLDGFVADFNAARGKPRLVLVLAPS